MKNIRIYDAIKYSNGEYQKVKDGIYKTTMTPQDNENYFGLNGIVDEELVAKLASCDGWVDGKEEFDADYQNLSMDGKIYYRDKIDLDDKEQEIWYYERDGIEPETVYVTSIVFEPEPEFDENEPGDSFVSQYPLEDILDQYYCYISDDYEEQNKEDHKNSYVEFASEDQSDIEKLLEIIGKHVYNKEDGDYIKLVIE